MYCGLRGIAPWQWLPQPSWFRWFDRLSALLFVCKEDDPDVPDVPELIEPLDIFETPVEKKKNRKLKNGEWKPLPKEYVQQRRFDSVPETFDEPELIEYKLADWATRTPADADVPGAYFEMTICRW